MTDIVIVNWNSGEFLNKCIMSIINIENFDIIGNIFVIDNHSSDNSLHILPENSKLIVIKNKENRGFAAGCNQGFRLCKSEYILLLNPDAQLFSNTIFQCEAFLKNLPEIDILGCQLLNDEGRVSASCSRFPSPLGFFIDATGLSKLAPSIFTPGIIMTDFNHKRSRFVDQVMGAFMFMRKSIFSKLGYFDEQFFVYFEEVDFSKRLAENKGKSFFSAEIKAIHSGEGTTNSVKAFRLFLSLQSRLKYAKKHFSQAGYLATWGVTFLVEPISIILFFLFQGKTRDVKEVLLGYKRLVLKKNI